MLRLRELNDEIQRMDVFCKSLIELSIIHESNEYYFHGILYGIHKIKKGKLDSGENGDIIDESINNGLYGYMITELLDHFKLNNSEKRLFLCFCRVYCFELLRVQFQFQTSQERTQFLFSDENINDCLNLAYEELKDAPENI